jgi:hypothetical protein
MMKTILILLLALVVFTAVGSIIDPAAHPETNSRWYYVSHPYVAYRTYTVVPAYPVYRRYYVAPAYPVYRVYPVYTYQYWYNRLAGPQKSVLDTTQPKKAVTDNSQELKKTGFDQIVK